jgi:hypothetical protein
MLIVTVCFSIIISKRKNNSTMQTEKLTDDIDVIDDIKNDKKSIIVDDDII